MNLVCPFCSSRFRAAVAEPVVEAVRLVCPGCQREMVLRPGVGRSAAGQQGARRNAVIVDEPRPFREFLERELKRLGFETSSFDRGDAALDAVRSSRADLVVINVALKKGKMGVELAEEIKKDQALASTRVALVGPLFRANRFRSDPATLFGADEYFEEMIPARALERRVRQLFDGARPQDSAEVDAQRLARLILSEIVGSNPQRVEEALRAGNLLQALATEIEAGRSYYNSHVPRQIRQDSQYYDEALQEFVSLKSEELA